MNNYEFWEKYNKFIKGEIGRLCRTKKELYIDLHIHSNYSADGKQNLKQILETTKEKGFDIIAITDHDSLNVYDDTTTLIKFLDLIDCSTHFIRLAPSFGYRTL